VNYSGPRRAIDEDLRGRAEGWLRKTRQDLLNMSTEDMQDLVHELQVHQVELQMQNEALQQAQAELEKSHDRYVDLYDLAPVGYLTINRDGIIEDANLMASALLECPRTELIGDKFSRFITEDDQDSWYIHSRAVFRTGERQSCHLKMRGEARYLHVNSQASPENIDYCRVTLNDVTMMKKLEGKLATMHKAAEAASAAKSQFLANMSHEIRTPLNAIIGLGGLLKRSPLNNRQTEYLSTLCTSADSLLALVTELLDFTKIESNSLELEYRPFSLRNIITDVLEISSVAAHEKNIDLLLEYDPDLYEWYFGDEHRLQQILLNLIGNAVKFTPEGSVTLRVGGQAMAQDRVHLEILIIDTGIGIPTDKQAAIFETFTQADASTTRKFGGTGLGLAISRKLVEYMDGEIDVTSVLGEGSVFSIFLPLQISPPIGETIDQSDKKTAIPVLGKRHILLVEDHGPNVLLATACLNEAGYQCDVARNGREAIRMFKNSRYAGILMDLQMPEMDGYETTAQIRAIEAAHGLSPTPIIAMTAHALTEDRNRCMSVGMNDFIAKPFHAERLQEKLAQIL
jgi:PAS domain S-box-containing protein